MKLNNKKGVSDVITTVLMILLVIAAIGILWLVVSRFVKTGTESVGSSSDCLTTTLDIESAVVNGTSGNLTARVKRSGSSVANLSNIKFVVDGTFVEVTPSTWPSVGETKTFYNISRVPVKPSQLAITAVIGDKLCPSESDSASITNN